MGAEETYISPGPSRDERDLFLQDIVTAARTYKSVLGESKHEGSSDERPELAKLLGGLCKEVAEFSPVLEVFPLTESHFKLRKMKMPPQIAELLRFFDFYLFNIPVTLVPQSGWGFTEVECSIELNENEPAGGRPVAHEVFPKEEWQNMIRVSQGLSVGLDENLKFKVDSGDLVENLPVASGSAGVKAHLNANAGLVIGPFQYNIRRPTIIARGRGNVKVYWRLSGGESLQTDDLRLGIVAKVPKAVSRVHVNGVLKASRSFNMLTADLGVLLKYVREKTRRFFEHGAPLTGTMSWNDVTSQVRGN